ncbi:hypothetical protein EmuJ_000274400 [Echinococcus multilocularis]|uniref:Uncharacterized protein n=1 Tax=Echinococcus multilocularis TaxID=6211 RepID=A0A068Y0Z9_ECHMU|nr:hypothetical protein EmuJ_000274400 [Echinococcus multilocularis]
MAALGGSDGGGSAIGKDSSECGKGTDSRPDHVKKPPYQHRLLITDIEMQQSSADHISLGADQGRLYETT